MARICSAIIAQRSSSHNITFKHTTIANLKLALKLSVLSWLFFFIPTTILLVATNTREPIATNTCEPIRVNQLLPIQLLTIATNTIATNCYQWTTNTWTNCYQYSWTNCYQYSSIATTGCYQYSWTLPPLHSLSTWIGSIWVCLFFPCLKPKTWVR